MKVQEAHAAITTHLDWLAQTNPDRFERVWDTARWIFDNDRVSDGTSTLLGAFAAALGDDGKLYVS